MAVNNRKGPPSRSPPVSSIAGTRSEGGAPAKVVRSEERKGNFVDDLVTAAKELIEVIWPLDSDECTNQEIKKPEMRLLPLRTFIQEILRRARVSYSTFQVTLCYLILVKEHVPDPEAILQDRQSNEVTRVLGSGRRMFVAALILASKYLQDRNYSTRTWSKITGLKVSEINTNQIAFLQAVNWKLYIPDSMWKKWQEIVCHEEVRADQEDAIFSPWKATIGSLTPNFGAAHRGLESTSEVAPSWKPVPSVAFHGELAKRNSLLNYSMEARTAAFPEMDWSDLESNFSGLTLDSVATSGTYQSAHSSRTTTTVATYMTAPMIDNSLSIIQEEQQSSTSLGTSAYIRRQRKELTSAYLTALHNKNVIQPFDKELNWSGQGQHVEFTIDATIPLEHIDNLGHSAKAMVDSVRCRRILLARKTMQRPRTWTRADAVNEVEHLNRLRHSHIVQLVGTYVQHRNFAVLMYPAAECDLRRFMEDTIDLQPAMTKPEMAIFPGTEYEQRRSALLMFPACLASALAYIHSQTTKHMDIKPANVLVKRAFESNTRDGLPGWKVYIADFGLSQSFIPDQSQTDSRTARTVRYCAPEVYLEETYGRAADVFSMGCVFTEILTVYAGFDIEELKDFLRGEGGTDHYHVNIDRTVGWIKNRTSGIWQADKLKSTLSAHLESMLCKKPEQRPTATEVEQWFRDFWSVAPLQPQQKGCCDVGPEPYAVENARTE